MPRNTPPWNIRSLANKSPDRIDRPGLLCCAEAQRYVEAEGAGSMEGSAAGADDPDGAGTPVFVTSAQATTVGSLADLLMTIANGSARSALVVVATTVFDEPPVAAVNWKGGPVTGPAGPLGAALAPALAPAAAGEAAALGAALAPVPGEPLGAGAPARLAQEPCSSTAGSGSLNPIATTPIVTAAEAPSLRSLMKAPPKTWLAFASVNEIDSLPADALADGSIDGAEEAPPVDGEPLAPAVAGAVVAAGLQAPNAMAARAMTARAAFREEARRSAVAARAPDAARAGNPSWDMGRVLHGAVVSLPARTLAPGRVQPDCRRRRRPLQVCRNRAKRPGASPPARAGARAATSRCLDRRASRRAARANRRRPRRAPPGH